MTPRKGNGRRTATRVAATALLCASIAGCGITGGLRGNPGYARFGMLEADGADREFALSLGPLPIKIAKVFLDDDPELTPLLRGLKAVRVYTYAVEDGARLRAYLEEVCLRLQDKGWEQIVAVRDDGESATALVRFDKKDSAILGFALVTYDDSDVTLVNVIGNVEPERVAPLIAGLDIDLPALAVARNSLDATALVDGVR